MAGKDVFLSKGDSQGDLTEWLFIDTLLKEFDLLFLEFALFFLSSIKFTGEPTASGDWNLTGDIFSLLLLLFVYLKLVWVAIYYI